MNKMSKWMTVNQVAKELGVSTKTIRRWEESKFLIPDERQETTNVRLYHPYRIGYWKKILELRRALKNHLRELDGIIKALDKHKMEQDFIPGKPLKLLTEEDLRQFTKAREDEENWEKEFRRLIDEFVKYPLIMRKATAEIEVEKI